MHQAKKIKINDRTVFVNPKGDVERIVAYCPIVIKKGQYRLPENFCWMNLNLNEVTKDADVQSSIMLSFYDYDKKTKKTRVFGAQIPIGKVLKMIQMRDAIPGIVPSSEMLRKYEYDVSHGHTKRQIIPTDKYMYLLDNGVVGIKKEDFDAEIKAQGIKFTDKVPKPKKSNKKSGESQLKNSQKTGQNSPQTSKKNSESVSEEKWREIQKKMKEKL